MESQLASGHECQKYDEKTFLSVVFFLRNLIFFFCLFLKNVFFNFICLIFRQPPSCRLFGLREYY
jgi:hypothetical protein